MIKREKASLPLETHSRKPSRTRARAPASCRWMELKNITREIGQPDFLNAADVFLCTNCLTVKILYSDLSSIASNTRVLPTICIPRRVHMEYYSNRWTCATRRVGINIVSEILYVAGWQHFAIDRCVFPFAKKGRGQVGLQKQIFSNFLRLLFQFAMFYKGQVIRNLLIADSLILFVADTAKSIVVPLTMKNCARFKLRCKKRS